MWDTSQGSVILFMWMSFIMNDLLAYLSIASPLVSADTLTAVVDNDRMMREKVLEYIYV